MSSDRLGKYREKPSRSRTPYSRPKGLIRRVTDSVSGLLGGSWIPGFLRNEEEEVHLRERSDTANSAGSRNAEHNHHQEPGPSGCSRPVTSTHQLSPRSLAALYPEEAGESDISLGLRGLDSQQHSNTLVALGRNSTGSAIRHNLNTVSFTMGNSGSSSTAISSDAPQIDPPGSGEESNLAATFSENTFREKYPEHRVHYSGLNPSETPVKTSLYNDVSSLHFSTAGPLQPFSFQQQTSSVTSAAHTFSQQDSTAPTPKTSAVGGQKLTPDLSRSGDSVSTPSARLSAAQSSSKRPRFSLAAYNAAATPVGNKSILSDGSFRSSPFYPGRTIYGGASAYRRTPTPVTPNRSATASPRMGAATSDAGLSDAAQRILSCLNSLSTPLTDAKRIPTPSASPYTSYLDSPYTAAFHKHRPNRPPPTASLSTPTKVGIQSNLSQYVFPSRRPSSQQQQSPSVQSSSKKPGDDFLDPAASSSSSTVQQPSIFSVAAASSSRSTSSVAPSPAKPIFSGNSTTQQQQQSLPRNNSSSSSNPLLQPSKPFCFDVTTERNDDTTGVTSTRSLRLQTVPEDSPPQSSVFSFTNTLERTDCGGGGKIKSDKKNSHLVSTRCAELQRSSFSHVTVSALPKVSLPNIVFTSPISLAGPSVSSVSQSATTSAEQPCSSHLDAPSNTGCSGKESSLHGFKFSVPEVVVKEREYTSDAGTTSQFSFSAPASVLMDDNTLASDNFVAPQPSSFVPKLKQTSPVQNKTLDSTRELITKPGGLLEFLSKTSNKSANDCSKSISSDSVTNISSISSGVSSSSYCNEPVQSGFGDKFKAAAGSWECNECLVRNKVEAIKCVACQMPKPGISIANTTAVSFGSSPCNVVSSKEKDNSSGFGNLFKKNSNEWDCISCLLRNKDTSEECVACKSAKPGSKISSSLPSSESSQFSFGVKPQSGNVNNFTSFGTLHSSTSGVDSKSTASTSSGPTTFVFGVKSAAVSTSASFPSPSSSSSVVASGVTKTSVTGTTASKDTPLEATAVVSENKGFGAAFKKASGDWDCSSCLLINKSSDNKCVACASGKPGCKSPSNDSNTFLKSDILVPVVGFGDKFKKAAGDWECESCLVTNKAALINCAACDSPKPGSLDNSKILTGNFKFNSTSKPSENASFKFGVTSGGMSTDVKIPTPSAGFTFGAPVTSANSLSATAFSKVPNPTTTANFTFGVAPVTSSNGGFNFGSAMDSAKKTVVDTNVAASNVTTNFSYVPPFNSSPTLKTTSVESAPKTIELKSGSVLDVLKNSTDKTKTNELTNTSQPVKTVFGGSVFEKAANSGSTAPIFNSLNTNSLSKPTFNFGSSGSAISKTNNLFQNSAYTMNSFETVSKTSNKRSLGVDDDCSGSVSCKKSGSPLVKNNGIAEPGSLFNMGKSDSQVGSTGSTAPALFTFGQCAAPAAKTATAFGGDVPAFGSAMSGFANNNNNTINDTSKPASKIYAFGQPSEKKPSASFDFGQATPTFNFSTSTAPSPFEFAQNSSSSAGNNGIFQFASGGSASTPSAVTPGFGDLGSNPFSQAPAATPSGRVMKKAIRRNKK